jgi:hypothetical protein
VKRFSGRSAQVELVVDARKRIGEAWQKLGREREAQKAFADAAAEFDRRNLKPESHPLAATAAAISRFQLAEYELQAFDKLKISGRGKALVRSLTAKKAAIKKASDAYTQVFKYKQLEWTLAAQFRRGYVLQRYATTLLESPVPPEVKRFGEEEVIAYQEAIANEALPFEDLAVQAYADTLQVARQNRVSNEWTRRVLEALNRLRPKDYPVLKEPKEYIAQEELYPEGLVVSVGAERQESSPARLSDGGDE